MSINDTTVSFSLEVNVDEAAAEVRRLQTVLYRALNDVRKLTGSENLDAAVQKMQFAIQVANQLRLAYAALMAVRMAAGDPLAWAAFAVSVSGVVVTVANEMELRSPEY